MKPGRINITKQQIIDFCKRNNIRRLAFFGSILRDDFREDSDVDVLIDLEPSAKVGLFDIAEMEIELSNMIGRKVDLKTPEDLSPYFRNEVLSSAEIQYNKE